MAIAHKLVPRQRDRCHNVAGSHGRRYMLLHGK